MIGISWQHQVTTKLLGFLLGIKGERQCLLQNWKANIKQYNYLISVFHCLLHVCFPAAMVVLTRTPSVEVGFLKEPNLHCQFLWIINCLMQRWSGDCRSTESAASSSAIPAAQGRVKAAEWLSRPSPLETPPISFHPPKKSVRAHMSALWWFLLSLAVMIFPLP